MKISSWSLLATVLWGCACIIPVTADPIQFHGINYSSRKGPDWYPEVDKCKTRDEILTDLRLLRKLAPRLRILSLGDCGQAEMVLDILRNEITDMQIWLGLWVGREPFIFEEEYGELKGLIERGMVDPDTVLGIGIGSEAIYREDATEAEMVNYVQRVKNLIQTNQLTLPITAVDTAPVYNVSPDLRAAVDVIKTNTFPFWESVPIENAVNDLDAGISYTMSLPDAQDKPFVLGETGWPMKGSFPGVGVASPENQQIYLQGFYCDMHVVQDWDYYWFTGIDNDWRQLQDPDNTVEGNWGIFQSDLQLKSHFQNWSFTCPSNGVEYSFSEIDFDSDTPISFPGNPAASPTTAPTTAPTKPPTPPPAPESTIPPTTVDYTACAANPRCAGLVGTCCPSASDGVPLACCDEPPYPSPPRTPTVSPSASPSRTSTVSPTAAPAYSEQTGLCNAYPQCSGLSGQCCPTTTGVMLACCEE